MITVSDNVVLSSATGTGLPLLMTGMLLSCKACRIRLTADESQHRREAVGQVHQPVEQTIDQEIQLA